MRTTVKILKRVIREELVRLYEEAERSDIEMKLNGAKELAGQENWHAAATELSTLQSAVPENVRSMFEQTIDYTMSQTRAECPNIEAVTQMIDKIIGMLRSSS